MSFVGSSDQIQLFFPHPVYLIVQENQTYVWQYVCEGFTNHVVQRSGILSLGEGAC